LQVTFDIEQVRFSQADLRAGSTTLKTRRAGLKTRSTETSVGSGPTFGTEIGYFFSTTRTLLGATREAVPSKVSRIWLMTLVGLFAPNTRTPECLMRTSQVLLVCLSLLVGYMAATALNRSSLAQPPAPQPSRHDVAAWRYQLTAPENGAFSNIILLTDTATGHCWMRANYQGAKWEDFGSPAERK
jgi:hypothetical protein